ncbi:MAG: GNAT family N-acetyltransferase [Melioribacteraceae bacterium]|nr:GNAT family N-acetyltransferase [Melioribacteraceae bacterium]
MNTEIFNSFPELKTKRLVLRQMNENDLEGVFKFNSSLANLNFIARKPFTDISQAKEKLVFFMSGFPKKNGIWWTFTLKPEDKLIGYGGLFDIDSESNKSEVGYGLLEEYWGKGIVSEAVKAIVDFGFNEMELNKIYGKIVPGNTASEKILEKLGFKKEGVLVDDEFARGKYFDMGIYSRLK